VAGGVEHDPARLGCGLELRRHCAEPLGCSDGRAKVLHVEVKMDLLGDRVVGPGGRAVTIYTDRTQPHMLGAHTDGLRGREDELPAEHRRPELRQGLRFRAVEGYEHAANERHAMTVTPVASDRPTSHLGIDPHARLTGTYKRPPTRRWTHTNEYPLILTGSSGTLLYRLDGCCSVRLPSAR
jgi:hypothetical protein